MGKEIKLCAFRAVKLVRKIMKLEKANKKLRIQNAELKADLRYIEVSCRKARIKII